MEEFLAHARSSILQSADIAETCETIAEYLSETPDSLDEDTEAIWDDIVDGYDCNRNVKLIETLRNISLNDVLEWFDEHLAPGGCKRRKLSVWVPRLAKTRPFYNKNNKNTFF